jgi:hypothetical protein
MIQVYIECGGYAECVATIADEWTYMELLPAFEQLAQKRGGILTESIIEDTTNVFVVWSEDEYSTDMDKYFMEGIYLSKDKADEKVQELANKYGEYRTVYIVEKLVS